MHSTAPEPKTLRRVVREPEVRDCTGSHSTTILRWERKGLFPKRIVIGPNTVGWYKDEIADWQASRQRQVDSGRPSPNPRTWNRA